MSVVDFKKTQKQLYQPGPQPAIVDVPKMAFIMIDGLGDPNTAASYKAAVETLYGLSYAIKMGNKDKLEYVVLPLEGFWTLDDTSFRGGGAVIADKSKFHLTMCIRQPEFVTPDVFDAAKASLAKKRPELDLSLARLEAFTEGMCAQIMHVGAYDDEPATIAKLECFVAQSGYQADMSGLRRHHEIYLSDPRKTATDKLRTIIRHPVR